jgi:hypothetical protein
MTDGKGNMLAVGEAVDRWDEENREADDEERQFGLFAEPQTEAGRARLVNHRRGPGRPPGSRNRRTERTVAFLLSRHRDPREVLIEIAEANVADLAALLGCSLFEAAQEKRLAAAAVLPYVAARLTPEVVDNRQVIHLTINGGGDFSAAGDRGAVALVLSPDDYQKTGEGDERSDYPLNNETDRADAGGHADDPTNDPTQ